MAAWFGFLGGGVAWTIHLVALSIIAEFGYFSEMQRYTFLGVTSIAWLVILLSVALAAIAVLATLAAVQTHRRMESGQHQRCSATYEFIARSGIYLSVTFLFIIVAETIPVFFFLTLR